MDEFTILPKELKKKLDSNEDLFLLDVRNPNEHEIAKLQNSKLIPLNELKSKLHEIPKDKEIIVYCHHGNRSREALKILKENGFHNVKSLVGGIDVWSRFIDSSILQY
ncbi:rhodanese-like domain-containing protein [Candidatus Woesearchaeota archaeon]|nr:rhodanese-like domain-containing protein [Candidatus Woesearchaeota archaeon]